MTPPAPVTRAVDLWQPVAWAGLAVGAAVAAGVLAGAVAGSTLPVLLGTSLTRSGTDATGVACAGLALLGVLLLPGGSGVAGGGLRDLSRVQGSADRALVAVAGAWLVPVLLGIAFRAADAFGRPLSAVRGADILQWATQLAAGRGMVLTAGCAAVTPACAVVRLRNPGLVQIRIPLIAALLGVLTPAVTGHAGSAPDHQLAVITVAMHVGAAALWVGRARGRAGARRAAPPAARRRAAPVLPAGGLLRRGGGGERRAQRDGPGGDVGRPVHHRLRLARRGEDGGRGAAGRPRRAHAATPRRRTHAVLRWAGIEVALMAATLGIAAALTQTA